MEIEWLEIPAGEFLFGLSEKQAKEFRHQMVHAAPDINETFLARETPQLTIHLPTFYISRYPITRIQFFEFISATQQFKEYLPHLDELESINHPMTCNWHGARDFCSWIGARLPSTYEWEKAARGTDGRLFPWGNEWDWEKGNFRFANRRGVVRGRKTSPVDAYPEGESPYGVRDAIGNCFEWTMSHILFHFPYEHVHFPNRYEQVITIRSSASDSDMTNPWAFRVTGIMVGGLFENEYPPYTGFRPIKDQWQKKYL